MSDKPIVIGTRGSALALWQAQSVEDMLKQHFPETTFQQKIIKTTGDINLETPLAEIGDKGLFTKDIEQALLDGSIDLAVHSYKDMETASPEGLMIAAVPTRQDCRDTLIMRETNSIDLLPKGAKILTGSLRRAAQIKHLRPDIQTENIRGNVQTRLQKFQESDADGLLMANAAIARLEIQLDHHQILSPIDFLPACAQGALAIQTRINDPEKLNMIKKLNDPSSEITALAERCMLATLEGGCQVPIGAYAQLEGNRLTLYGMIANLDGTELIRDHITINLPNDDRVSHATKLGRDLAIKLCEIGGRNILNKIRNNN